MTNNPLALARAHNLAPPPMTHAPPLPRPHPPRPAVRASDVLIQRPATRPAVPRMTTAATNPTNLRPAQRTSPRHLAPRSRVNLRTMPQRIIAGTRQVWSAHRHVRHIPNP